MQEFLREPWREESSSLWRAGLCGGGSVQGQALRGSLCSSSGRLRDSGWWLRKEFQENPTSRACPPELGQASGRSHHGGVGEGLCAGRRPAGPLLPLPLLSRSPLGAALSGDACAAPRIPPCSGQQRPGGTRTHCWLRLPRPGTDLELAFMAVAGAGRDRSPVCPWPGPPLAGHASIQRDRCEVRPELSGPALGGRPEGVTLPEDIGSCSPCCFHC